jgi:hypothetical protein
MTCHPARSDRLKQEHNRQMWAAAWTGAVQGAVAGARGAPPAPAQVRIGDAERESAVTALGEHYAAGRITKEEFDERSSTAWSARTSGDLVPLFGDLPRLQAPAPRRPQPPRARWRLGMGLWWVFLFLLVLATAGQVPWVMVAIFAGLWWTGVFTGLHRWAHRGRAAPPR